MAAHDGPPKPTGRDALRFTTDFPILQSFLDPSKVRAAPPAHLAASLGNLEQLNNAVSQLLEVAINNNQQDRVALLLDFQAQIAKIPAQVFETLGREVPLSEIELQLPAKTVSAFQAPSSDDEEEEDHFDDLSTSSSSSSSSSHTDTDDHSDDEVEDCPVCFDEFPPSEMRTLLACGVHKYCRECMNRHLSTLINDSELKSLKCPFPSCTIAPEEYEIENLVSEETYMRYLQFSALASLKTESGTKWCINKACGEPIIWDEKEKKVVCPSCKTEFCYDCGKAPHEGRPCGQEPASGEGGAAGGEEDSVQTWLRERGAKVKPCPKCKEGIEKNDGCNHITCRNCSHQWCWLCSGDYLQPPNHFGQGLCSGMQFTRADTIEEALEAQGRSREQAEQEAREALERREREEEERRAAEERRQAFLRTPEGQRQERRRRKREEKRRRHKKVKKIAKYTALAPVIVVGGVLAVGVAVITSPVWIPLAAMS